MEARKPVTLTTHTHVASLAETVVTRFDLAGHRENVTIERGKDDADGNGVWQLKCKDVVIARSETFYTWNGMTFWKKRLSALRQQINKERREQRRREAHTATIAQIITR